MDAGALDGQFNLLNSVITKELLMDLLPGSYRQASADKYGSPIEEW
jgi:hypothetical protein